MFTQYYYWSDPNTWNGDFPPQDGDSVYIPAGMNVLVDSDQIGVLRAVLIEGTLVFRPNPNPTHTRTFDAYYIFVKDGGLMQVGTETEPYTSKIIFTMHGNRQTLKIPTYGNKVIAV